MHGRCLLSFAWCTCLHLSAPQVMHFMYNMFVDPFYFKERRQIALTQWSSTWQVGFHERSVEMLLAIHCSDIGVTTKKSGICALILSER